MAQHISQHRVFRPGVRPGGAGVAGGDSACSGRAGQGAASAAERPVQAPGGAVGTGVAHRRVERRRGCHGQAAQSDDFVGITMSGQVVTKMQLLDRMRRRRTVLTPARSGRRECEADWARPRSSPRWPRSRARTKACRCMGLSLHQGVFAGGHGGVADHELRGDAGRACLLRRRGASQRGWSSCSGCPTGCEARVRRRDGLESSPVQELASG